MTDCCRSAPCEEMFGSRTAEGDLEEYLRRGLGALEERMLAAIPAATIAGAERVLEIGGGIGALQAEMLLRGAASGEVVELVRAYEPYARRLSDRLGLGDRTTFRVTDVIEEPHLTEAADVVVLNRVVCCSREGLELTRVAAGLSRRLLALSYPRPLLVLRWAAWLQEPLARLFRRQYRFYVHSADALRLAATSTGMSLFATGGGPFWRYSVFAHPLETPGAATAATGGTGADPRPGTRDGRVP